jgi:hypothetical protein
MMTDPDDPDAPGYADEGYRNPAFAERPIGKRRLELRVVQLLKENDQLRAHLVEQRRENVRLQHLIDLHNKVGAMLNKVVRERDAAEAEVARLRAALEECVRGLKRVALSGTEDLSLWAWCDDGWTCTHNECVANREAIRQAEDALAEPAADA